MGLVFSIGETREKIREIQLNSRKGLMTEINNKASRESMFVVSSKMIEGIAANLPAGIVDEYDDALKIHTVYSRILPQIYGEGSDRENAVIDMIDNAAAFASEYMENPEVMSGIFDGYQQFLLNLIILHSGNKKKIKEIMKVV